MKKTINLLSSFINLFSLVILLTTLGFNVVLTVSYEQHEIPQLLFHGIKVLPLLVLFILFFTSLIKLINKKEIDRKLLNKYIFFATAVNIIIKIIVVLNFKIVPGGDQMEVYNIANQFVKNDFQAFLYCNYLARYPQNIAISYFYSFLVNINDSFIFLQVVNTFVLEGIFVIIFMLVKKFSTYKAAIITHLLLSLSIPLLMLQNLIYGDIYAIFFALLGLYLYLNKKLSIVILGLLSISMSILFKFNIGMIFAIAITIHTLINFKKRNYIVLLILPLLIVPDYLVKNVANNVHGNSDDGNVPFEYWILMGVEEGFNGVEGFYNNDVMMIFDVNYFSNSTSKPIFQKEIKSRVGSLLRNPSNAVHFYRMKFMYTFADPTYQLYNYNAQYDVQNPKYDNLNLKNGVVIKADLDSRLYTTIFDKRTNDVLYLYSCALLITLLYNILKKFKLKEQGIWMLSNLISVGFFSYLMISEIKPRYALSMYFMFFILFGLSLEGRMKDENI